jgi:hypothetical protein
VLDAAGGRRLNPGIITGGRQLNAGPLGCARTSLADDRIIAEHKHCSRHREEILASTFPSLEVRALQASEPATVSKYVAAELARGDAVITPRPTTVAGLPAVEFAVLQSVFVLHEEPPKGDSRIVRHSVAFEHRGHVYTCYLETWPHQHAAYARVLQRFCSSGRRGSA